VAIVLVAACLVLPVAASARADEGRTAGRSLLAPLAVPKQLRVVSYYPADAGWTRMWEPWRPARLAADLHRLRSLNANTVRIVVSPPFFGYPEPESTYVERLSELVSIAAAEGLHVQLTLFDWWGDYRDLDGSKLWAGTLLAPYVGDPRVAFVELRNEIDPADPEAMAWARELVPWIRRLLGNRTPVALSVGGKDLARDLRALSDALPAASRPDFFSAHYFTGGGERAADVFGRLRAAAAPTALWVGELGYPTSTTISGFDGIPLTRSAQEAAQAHYLRLCFAALRRLGLPDPGIWILDDFTPGAIPVSDVSPKEPEYSFGLFRTDGTKKNAASTLRRLFSGARDLSFNGSFEQEVVAADGTPLPAAWSVLSLRNLRVARDATVAHTGRASARFATSGASPGSGILRIAPVDGAAARQAGPVTATGWMRGGSATGKLWLAISWFDGDLQRVGRSSTGLPLPVGRSWARVTVSSRAPAGAVFARVAIQATSLRGTVWVDDVSFSRR
jgi:hypothetical protein